MVDIETASRLRGVISRLARQFNTAATDEGLTPTQASILGLIGRRGPLRLADLAEIEGLNPTMLSRVIGRLDELGYIKKSPDPTDLRATRVTVTGEGRQLFLRIRALRTEVVSDCLERLPVRTVERILNAVEALEELEDEVRLDRTKARGGPAARAV